MPGDIGITAISRHTWVAFVLAGCALGLGVGSLDAAAAPADNSTLIITYTTPTALQVTLADGTVVKTGSVVPAGSYGVRVIDDPKAGDPNPNITISGPGVDLTTNLESGMGIPAMTGFGPYTFQTNSSYTIEDSNLGASSLVTFTTTSTSTAGGSAPGGSTSVSSSGGSPAKAGSGGTALRGTLTGSVSSSGVATLMLDGKAVKKVSAGSYTVTINDHSRSVGFILEGVSKQPIAISSAGAVGRRSKTVMLSAGKWSFESSAKGPRFYFSVVT